MTFVQLTRPEIDYLLFVISNDMETINESSIVEWTPDKIVATDLLAKLKDKVKHETGR